MRKKSYSKILSIILLGIIIFMSSCGVDAEKAARELENAEVQEQYIPIKDYYFTSESTTKFRGDYYYLVNGLDSDYLYYPRPVPGNISAGITFVRYTKHQDEFGLIMKKESRTPIQRYGAKSITLTDKFYTATGTWDTALFSTTDPDTIQSFLSLLDTPSCWQETGGSEFLYLVFELDTEEKILYYPTIYYRRSNSLTMPWERFYISIHIMELVPDMEKDQFGYFYRTHSYAADITAMLNDPYYASLKDAIKQVFSE